MKIIPILSTLALGLAAPAFAQEAAPSAPPAAPSAQAAPGSAEAAPSAPQDSSAQAPAATAATAKAGDTIYDTAGQAVGTVESVEGANFVISTGANMATLPLSALASGPNGPTIGMNKAQLDAAIQQATGK